MERCVVALTSSSVNEEAYSEVQTQLNSQEATPILIIVFAEVDMLWFFASKLQSSDVSVAPFVFRSISFKYLQRPERDFWGWKFCCNLVRLDFYTKTISIYENHLQNIPRCDEPGARPAGHLRPGAGLCRLLDPA